MLLTGIPQITFHPNFNSMRYIYILIIIISLFSCNKYILENRKECPAILTLDLSNIDNRVNELHVWIFDTDKNIVKKDTIWSSYFGKEYLINVPRGSISYYLWVNLKSATYINENNSLDSYLTNLENFQPDSLYFSSNTLDSDKETLRDTVFLLKEFITIYFTIIGDTRTSEITLEGTTNNAGYYINGKLVSKKTSQIILPNSTSEKSAEYEFRVTRQNNLTDINIEGKTTTNNIPTTVFSLPLSNYIMESMYDMKSPSLEDIKVEVDLTSNLITIYISDWQKTFPVFIEF